MKVWAGPGRAGLGRAGRPAERGRHTLWNINDLLKRRTQPPPRYPSLPPSSHLPPCCSFPLSLSVSSPLRLPLSPSSSPSLPLSLSQEGCEIVLCHIKETGALQSEKYDIIRIIRGNLWIRHRSLDPCESGFLEEFLFSRSFISFPLSFPLNLLDKSLGVLAVSQQRSVFYSLSQFVTPPCFPPSLLWFWSDTSKTSTKEIIKYNETLQLSGERLIPVSACCRSVSV